MSSPPSYQAKKSNKPVTTCHQQKDRSLKTFKPTYTNNTYYFHPRSPPSWIMSVNMTNGERHLLVKTYNQPSVITASPIRDILNSNSKLYRKVYKSSQARPYLLHRPTCLMQEPTQRYNPCLMTYVTCISYLLPKLNPTFNQMTPSCHLQPPPTYHSHHYLPSQRNLHRI